MYVFLTIIIELASVVGSVVITFNTAIDGVLEIGKCGYRIDKDILEEIKEKNKKKKERSKFKKILDWVLLFTPGINLITAGIGYFKFKHLIRKSIKSDPKIKEMIFPMTEEEKEEYSKIKSRVAKMDFLAENNKKQEYTGFKSSYDKKDEDDEYDLFQFFEMTPDKEKEYEEHEMFNSKYIVNLDESQYREIYDDTDETKIEEEQGPVLKKTLKGSKRL